MLGCKPQPSAHSDYSNLSPFSSSWIVGENPILAETKKVNVYSRWRSWKEQTTWILTRTRRELGMHQHHFAQTEYKCVIPFLYSESKPGTGMRNLLRINQSGNILFSSVYAGCVRVLSHELLVLGFTLAERHLRSFWRPVYCHFLLPVGWYRSMFYE